MRTRTTDNAEWASTGQVHEFPRPSYGPDTNFGALVGVIVVVEPRVGPPV
jgi:hypothetical protein